MYDFVPRRKHRTIGMFQRNFAALYVCIYLWMCVKNTRYLKKKMRRHKNTSNIYIYIEL